MSDNRITLDEVRHAQSVAWHKYQAYQHALEQYTNAKRRWEAQQRDDFNQKRTQEALALFQALTPAQRARIIKLLETHNAA